MTTRLQPIHFVVNGTNRVVDFACEWDATAARTDGGSCFMRVRVVRQPLDRLVAVDATKMFVLAAVHAARLMQQIRFLAYSGDSPNERRRFEMVIAPLVDGHVQVEHRLLSAEVREPQGQIPKRPSRAGRRCSQGQLVRQAARTAWRDSGGFAPPAQDVCPPCGRRVFDLPTTVPG